MQEEEHAYHRFLVRVFSLKNEAQKIKCAFDFNLILVFKKLIAAINLKTLFDMIKKYNDLNFITHCILVFVRVHSYENSFADSNPIHTQLLDDCIERGNIKLFMYLLPFSKKISINKQKNYIIYVYKHWPNLVHLMFSINNLPDKLYLHILEMFLNNNDLVNTMRIVLKMKYVSGLKNLMPKMLWLIITKNKKIGYEFLSALDVQEILTYIEIVILAVLENIPLPRIKKALKRCKKFIKDPEISMESFYFGLKLSKYAHTTDLIMYLDTRFNIIHEKNVKEVVSVFNSDEKNLELMNYINKKKLST